MKPIRGCGAIGGLAIVAEAPGSEELLQGWPLVGPTGKQLNEILRLLNIDRHSCWLTNSLLCQRPVGDSALLSAVNHCRQRLQAELIDVAPSTILALGGTAAVALKLPVSTVASSRGTVQNSPLFPNIPVIVSIHPAALFKGGAGEMGKGKGSNQKQNVDAQRMFLEADIGKAWRISTGELSSVWSDDVEIVVDGNEALAKAMLIVNEARAWGILALDLEWSQDGHVTWIGLGHKGRAVSFCRDTIGDDTLRYIATAFADETLPKLIHNLQADKGAWEADFKSPLAGTIEDTMMLHHAAYPGIAHELQSVASQFLVVPPWKVQRKRQRSAALKAEKQGKAIADKQAAHDLRNAATKAKAAEAKAARIAAHEARNAERKKMKSAPVAVPVPAPVFVPSSTAIVVAAPVAVAIASSSTVKNNALRPFFSFYGGKWRVALKYPVPVYDTIVEPFAGSAGYSLRYYKHNVILVERDPVIAATWRYLLHVSPSEILELPDIGVDQSVADLQVCQEARWLIGWWLNAGTIHPCNTPSAWMRNTLAFGGSPLYWGSRVRERIAAQLQDIKHWQLIEGDYHEVPVGKAATWFVDPPYQVAGKHYRFGADQIDYQQLAQWCKSLPGQVIVCENVGAGWLPFQPWRDIKACPTKHGGKISREAIWTNSALSSVTMAPVAVPVPAPVAVPAPGDVIDAAKARWQERAPAEAKFMSDMLVAAPPTAEVSLPDAVDVEDKQLLLPMISVVEKPVPVVEAKSPRKQRSPRQRKPMSSSVCDTCGAGPYDATSAFCKGCPDAPQEVAQETAQETTPVTATATPAPVKVSTAVKPDEAIAPKKSAKAGKLRIALVDSAGNEKPLEAEPAPVAAVEIPDIVHVGSWLVQVFSKAMKFVLSAIDVDRVEFDFVVLRDGMAIASNGHRLNATALPHNNHNCVISAKAVRELLQLKLPATDLVTLDLNKAGDTILCVGDARDDDERRLVVDKSNPPQSVVEAVCKCLTTVKAQCANAEAAISILDVPAFRKLLGRKHGDVRLCAAEGVLSLGITPTGASDTATRTVVVPPEVASVATETVATFAVLDTVYLREALAQLDRPTMCINGKEFPVGMHSGDNWTVIMPMRV